MPLYFQGIRYTPLPVQAVIVIVFLPVFQLDDKIDVLFLLDTLNTIECLDIDDSDSAQFDKISRDVR